MKTCFELSDLRADIKELRTPLDKRTYQRKALIKKVKEMYVPFYKCEYGIYSYLSFKDRELFISYINNN